MITVVVASYYYGHLASHALESVLAQTLPPQEIILVDDGAHDDVDLIAHKYKVKIVERDKNLGIVANFNDVLFNHVRTPKVMFLGADNWLRPDALEKMNLDADIVSSDIAITGEEAGPFARGRGARYKDGYYIWEFTKGDIAKGNYIHGSSLYNTELAKQVGGYMPSGNRMSEEDWMLWKRMIAKGATHLHVAEPLLYYRRHRNNFQKY